MKELKHTKGPWHLTLKKVNEDGSKHYSIELENCSGWRGQEYMCFSGIASEANARLVASAPDLLEALIAIRTSLQNRASIFREELSDDLEIVCNAIKKATE